MRKLRALNRIRSASIFLIFIFLTLLASGQTPTKLVVTTQPVIGSGHGTLMTVQPVVEIRDASNQKVSTSNAQVRIVISSGTGGTIGGTTIINAVNGVATFTDLTFSGVNNQSYVFQFISAPLIAYEPFAYGAGTLTGNNGGTGWSGAWYGANPAFTDLDVNTSGFSYTNFSTSGGRATYISSTGGDGGRLLPAVSNSIYPTVWIAFLANYDLQGGGFNNLRLYQPGGLSGAVGGNGGVSNWAILDNTLTASTFTSFPLNGTLHLALLKIDYTAGTSSLWIDPTVASFDGTQTPSITQSFAPIFDRIELYNRMGSIGTDEITVASTYKAALHLEQNLTSDLSASVTLPVSWTNFTASCVSNGTLLKWGTSDEQNNQHFLIEKSNSNSQWATIGKVDGAGNQNGSDHQYEFKDTSNTGLVYYRLRQVDYNGNSSVSKIVTTNCHTNRAESFRIFPNPASHILHLTGLPFNTWYHLINARGHTVRTGKVAGSSTIIFLNGLQAGNYFIIAAGYPVKSIVIVQDGK